MKLPRLIVILGQTASGKSEVAVELAQRLHAGGQIIGADSMQVYRGLDAGTAKPRAALRARVPHHMIDIVEPTEPFTVHDWLERVEPLIDRLITSGVWPLVVGGTNLYLKALLEGMFDGPGRDPAFRASLERLSEAQLHQRLTETDPAAGERISMNDRRRMIRALEVHHLTGQPISELQTQWGQSEISNFKSQIHYRHDPILIGLDWPRDAINHRINARVKEMFFPAACGLAGVAALPDEVSCLLSRKRLGLQARQAIGYKQVLAYLEGGDARIKTLDDAFEQTKVQTRRFAKQQRTWLKRFRGVHWLDAAGHSAANLAREAAGIVQEADAAI